MIAERGPPDAIPFFCRALATLLKVKYFPSGFESFVKKIEGHFKWFVREVRLSSLFFSAPD